MPDAPKTIILKLNPSPLVFLKLYIIELSESQVFIEVVFQE